MAGSQLYHVAWHYRQIPAMVDVMASCSSAPLGKDLSRFINVQFILSVGAFPRGL